MSAKERWRRRAIAWNSESGNTGVLASGQSTFAPLPFLGPLDDTARLDLDSRALQVRIRSLEIEVIEKRLDMLRLEEENQQLGRQLSTWRGEWDREQSYLEEQIAALRKERDVLAKQLEGHVAQSPEASCSQSEVSELRKEIARLRTLRKNHGDALEKLEKENRRLRREIRVVEGELNRTRQRMENRHVSDREISERLNFLDQEVETWRHRCRDRDDDVDLLQAEILGFRSLVSEKESSLADQELRQRRQEREIESLKRDLGNRKKAFEEAETLLIAQSEELDRALAQLTETQELAEARHSNAWSQDLLLEKKREEIAAKERRISELEEALRAENVSTRLKEAKKEAEHWRREAEQHERQSLVLQANLQRARENRGGSVVRELEASRDLLEDQQKTLGERESELEALRGKLRENEVARRQERKDLLGRLEEVEALRHCEREAAALRLTRTKELAREQSTRLEILQEKYEILKNEISKHERRFHGLNARKSDREVRLEKELEGRRLVLDELQRRIVGLEGDIRGLKGIVFDRDGELARLREQLLRHEPTEKELASIRRQLSDVATELEQRLQELGS